VTFRDVRSQPGRGESCDLLTTLGVCRLGLPRLGMVSLCRFKIVHVTNQPFDTTA
jgi:hypothetical protein